MRKYSKILHKNPSLDVNSKKRKKSKKVSKKVLTRGEECGIITRLSRKKAAWSLKIEQQEISTKQM